MQQLTENIEIVQDSNPSEYQKWSEQHIIKRSDLKGRTAGYRKCQDQTSRCSAQRPLQVHIYALVYQNLWSSIKISRRCTISFFSETSTSDSHPLAFVRIVFLRIDRSHSKFFPISVYLCLFNFSWSLTRSGHGPIPDTVHQWNYENPHSNHPTT